jgi:hypothetical protein
MRLQRTHYRRLNELSGALQAGLLSRSPYDESSSKFFVALMFNGTA